MKVIYLPDARKDILEAAAWYRKKASPAIAQRFRDQIKRTRNRIQQAPEIFPKVYQNRQRALVDVFPYLMYFVVGTDAIFIFAVVHGGRHPRVWSERLLPNKQ